MRPERPRVKGNRGLNEGGLYQNASVNWFS